MSTPNVEFSPQAQQISFTENDLVIDLVDGRTVSVPLVWFPRLAGATRTQLEHFEILGNGEGIHWPDIDEDLSVAGLLRGPH